MCVGGNDHILVDNRAHTQLGDFISRILRLVQRCHLQLMLFLQVLALTIFLRNYSKNAMNLCQTLYSLQHLQ